MTHNGATFFINGQELSSVLIAWSLNLISCFVSSLYKLKIMETVDCICDTGETTLFMVYSVSARNSFRRKGKFLSQKVSEINVPNTL